MAKHIFLSSYVKFSEIILQLTWADDQIIQICSRFGCFCPQSVGTLHWHDIDHGAHVPIKRGNVRLTHPFCCGVLGTVNSNLITSPSYLQAALSAQFSPEFFDLMVPICVSCSCSTSLKQWLGDRFSVLGGDSNTYLNARSKIKASGVCLIHPCIQVKICPNRYDRQSAWPFCSGSSSHFSDVLLRLCNPRIFGTCCSVLYQWLWLLPW